MAGPDVQVGLPDQIDGCTTGRPGECVVHRDETPAGPFFQRQAVRARNVVFGGGLPLREGGALIGGIGVSGGSAEQDEDCARAAMAALGLAGD